MTIAMIAEAYVSVSMAAVALRVNSNKVYRLCQAGDIDALLIGGRWMVDRASLERYRSAHKNKEKANV